MPQPAQSTLPPWIESLILSYDHQAEEGGGGGGGGLKAHVITVGQMSQSQARGPGDPMGLLFLSDGALQIPAVLTASAWERLQEEEDREGFAGLLNAAVTVQDYQLQFHMDPEETKCRFFLLVRELSTMAAGSVKDSTPCCVTLPSVRAKVCRTWRALLGQPDTQSSQRGFDLSELMGEWQHDRLRAVLDDVRERLTAASSRPVSPQPSTSAGGSSLTRHATGWDVDRVRHKREERFSVPVTCLLIPEEDQQLQTGDGGGTPADTAPPSGEEPDWWRGCDIIEGSPLPAEDGVLQEDMIVGTMDRPPSNPWDMFPPPCVTSSSESSPEATPTLSLHAAFKSDPAAMLTSTQAHSSKESGSLPLYQKHPSGLLVASSSVSRPTSDRLTAQRRLREGEEEEEGGQRKRKQSELTAEGCTASVEEEEEEVSRSPPSWLFSTQTGADGLSSPKQTVLRKTPVAHGDGTPFSYSYRASGGNLQDVRRLRVAGSALRWAVRYLVAPEPTDD